MSNSKPLFNKRIYIYDDNPDNVYVLHQLLRHEGAQTIIGFWSRGHAADMVRHLPIDVILMDLMLPGGRTGFDVKVEIQDIPELANIPFVAVSSADASAAMPKAIQTGFKGYISKPIDADTFPQQVADIIAGEPVWAGR